MVSEQRRASDAPPETFARPPHSLPQRAEKTFCSPSGLIGMASVFRNDTGEFLGFLPEPEGPLAGGITYWPFRAWRHSNGELRSEPKPANGQDNTAPEPLIVDIPVSNNDSADVHLIVPPELVEFVLTHTAFRAAPPPVARSLRSERSAPAAGTCLRR